MEQIPRQLFKYVDLKQETENLLDRLARMKSSAELPPMREADGSQHTSSSGDRMGRAVEAYMAYEAQIMPIVEANRREMLAVEQAVARLDDPQERDVLRARYLDGAAYRHPCWWEVAYIVYRDTDVKYQRAAQRIHRRALRHFKNP